MIALGLISPHMQKNLKSLGASQTKLTQMLMDTGKYWPESGENVPRASLEYLLSPVRNKIGNHKKLVEFQSEKLVLSVWRTIEIRPHRSVGAGRATGALAFELVTLAKTSSHIPLQGLYFASRARGWGCRATEESLLKVDFGRIFGYVLPLLPCRLAFWRGDFVFWGGFWFDSVSPWEGFGVVLDYAEATWSKMNPYSLQHSPKSPKLAPRWHQGSQKVALLDPKFWSCWGEGISGCKTNNVAEQNLTYSFNIT